MVWNKVVVPRVLAAEYGVLPLFLYRPCEEEEQGEEGGEAAEEDDDADAEVGEPGA